MVFIMCYIQVESRSDALDETCGSMDNEREDIDALEIFGKFVWFQSSDTRTENSLYSTFFHHYSFRQKCYGILMTQNTP